MDKETRREIIMDNYSHPINRGLTKNDKYITKNTSSDSCIDNITLELKAVDGIIEDIHFDGEACAICTSATSILVRTLMGKTLSEARDILDNFKKMLNEEKYNKEILGDLIVYEDLYLQPSRKNCALLPSKTAEKILEELGN